MDIKLDNEKLHGEITMPPSMALLHMSLVASALTSLSRGQSDAWDYLCSACGSINSDIQATQKGMQTILGKATNTQLSEKVMVSPKGAKVTMDTKEFNLGMLPKTTVACGDSEDTLKLLMPVAAALGVDVGFICGRTLYGSRIETMADQMERHGTVLMKAPMFAQAANASGMICVSGMLLPGAYIVPSNVPVQFLAGLLFSMPLLSAKSTLRVLGSPQSIAYIQLALTVLDRAGINIRTNDSFTEFEIEGNQNYNLKDAEVEGDWSIGAYFVAAGAIGRVYDTKGRYAQPIIYPSVKEGVLPCGNINVHNLSFESCQADKEIVNLINEMSEDMTQNVEIKVDGLTNIVPILAVYAALRTGATGLNGISRLKDGDCIRYTCDMIRDLGGRVRMEGDRLIIFGSLGLKGGLVATHNDWRIAMAAAMAARICEEPVIIEDAESATKVYSKFYEEYGSLQW